MNLVFQPTISATSLVLLPYIPSFFFCNSCGKMAHYQNTCGGTRQTDEYDNQMSQSDEYGNPIRQTDEYGNPTQRTGTTGSHGTTGFGTTGYGTATTGTGVAGDYPHNQQFKEHQQGGAHETLRRSGSSGSSSVSTLSLRAHCLRYSWNFVPFFFFFFQKSYMCCG